MLIPVFLSCPTVLNKVQARSRALILDQLARLRLEPRAIGRSDYPTDFPLREVYVIAKHCSGGVILGFEQFVAPSGKWKRGTTEARDADPDTVFPSPWNNLEAGILFGLKLPLLVFRERGISGGVFDNGVTDTFVHAMPRPPMKGEDRSALRDVFLKWQASVRSHFYQL